MEKKLESICGLECDKCSYREPHNCPGCGVAKGSMFWGNCNIATCCLEKGLEHCGHCCKFACKDLEAFAYDNTHGDAEGSRILKLKARLGEKG